MTCSIVWSQLVFFRFDLRKTKYLEESIALSLHLCLDVRHLPVELLPPADVQLDPLPRVAHRGVLQQGPEDHPEAEG